MAKRNTPLLNNEIYHIYNRGVDKRNIFLSENDVSRFLQCMEEFNTIEPIGSIYENSFKKSGKQLGHQAPKLVEIIAYCLNPNHYHFILRQIADDGISKFMGSLNGGYSRFFNEKEKRSGALFQGKFRSVHIESDAQLLYTGAYVNLNYIVHGLVEKNGKPSSPLIRSSWDEYVGKTNSNMCTKEIILDRFNNIEKFKKDSLGLVKEIARKREEVKHLLLEEE